jgi:hypothetical protein
MELHEVFSVITVALCVFAFIWGLRTTIAEGGSADPETAIQEIIRNGGYAGLHKLMVYNWDVQVLSAAYPDVYAELCSYRLIPLSRYTKEVIWNSLQG